MNLYVCPYHDYRKILKEGYRTRDAHLIEHFLKNDKVGKVIILNRPTTILEIALMRKRRHIDGKILVKTGNIKLIQVSDKLFVIDYISFDIIGQLIRRRKWFVEKFGGNKLINFCNKVFEDIAPNAIISCNILASRLFNLPFEKKLFDAWDNFELFPNMQSDKPLLEKCYAYYANTADLWTTNAFSNVTYFGEKYKVDIKIVNNGVDYEKINQIKNESLSPFPENIPVPIAGFGGKFSHLLDVDLINYIIHENPEISFVFAGQKLEPKVYNAINKASNFYYLGDLKYEDYIKVISKFNIGILPYVVNERETGANSIKLYEYLSAGIQVVATNSSGADLFEDCIFIAKNMIEFSQALQLALKFPIDYQNKFEPNEHSWEQKSNMLLNYVM